MSVLATVDRPAHVPAALAVDFDFMRPGPEGSDPFEAWIRLHGLPPLVWTPRNGGHWLATRGEDIPAILKDHERFSSSRAFIGMIDRPKAVPLEYDPPEHGPLRKILIPAFTPKAVSVWSAEARRLSIELIEGFKPDGGCEFISDFAQQLPMIIFLKIVDLPLDHRRKLIDWVGTGLRSTDTAQRIEARTNLNAYLESMLDRRLANPGDDLFSMAIQADIGGRRMNRQEALGLGSALLGGGLDPRSFECPMEVRFDRKDSYKHSTLSHGIHRCIGAALASQEMKIFLEEWLARIADFSTDPDDPPVMATGIVHGLTRLPLRWNGRQASSL